MDIRDIQPDCDHGSKNFTRMVELQKELIDHYVGIEGLPQYPIRLDMKSSQTLIKDFVGRVIEELGEGYESWETCNNMFHRGISRNTMIPHLQNFNEECADAVHFWLELLIFVGIGGDWINKYLDYGTDDTLGNLFKAGRMQYIKDFGGRFNPPGFRIIADGKVPEYLQGGNILSDDRDTIMSKLLWKITYKLQMARNCLKNKPWKQTQMQTDEASFMNNLLDATVYMFAFFDFVGMDKVSLYHIYYRKNRINYFRIKSKY